MISCQQIEKYYGAEQVLSHISFEFNEGEKVGLVGQNGSGKSTLLHVLAGLEQPDRGTISVPKGTRIGYLTQIQGNDPAWTVYDVLQQGFDEALRIQAQLRESEISMTSDEAVQDPHVMDSLLRKYAELQEAFERAGGYEIETRIHQIANGIGIPTEQFQRTFNHLSGGEKTKVALAKLLIEQPNFLLLDEPTNHLDLNAVEWLERYIVAYPGTCLIASHDRYFLDRVVTQIIEIEDGEASTYLTNYSDYHKEKQQKLLLQFEEYKDQQKRIKQMKEAIKRYIEWGNIGGNEKFFKRAASIQKALDRMDKIKRPVLERKKVDFQLDFAGRSGKDVLVCRDIEKGYAGRNLLQKVTLNLAYGDRVAMIGGNGVGKSTLFKLILGEEQPDQGEIRMGARVEVGYLAQDAPPLEKATVIQYFRNQVDVEEGEARGMLAKYLFYGAAVFKSVMNLSGGEWTRLKLALIMQQSPNFLLLDEPTNHLDIASREALEEMLEEFPGTVLTISHDRYFINQIAEQVWSLHNKQVTCYLGDFDAYKEQSEKEKARNTSTVSVQRTHAPARENRNQEVLSTSKTSRRKIQLEQQIALKEQDQCSLELALLSEEHRTDAEMLARLVAEQAAVQEALNELYEQWLELEDGMEG
ncbi:ABC transporter ATP-binding protein [Paenibacillus selenitireducens]|uniref:ABC transporter ATP-binding protein n=1 Tax=Paenibacillus selenitireducens TaxID=1324314 RepID=A0A1T2XCV8_9BACL|nr:ABC-F family ATP-binding cassette domain-containing protein [Paenibacillus selenitireducens]OPA77690.1 ABC transporter ATP-binding protein [Paenibacillus selenitireducens]